MIESPQNEKLKLVRKLRDRKHREREGLFATEGEDLLRAGLAAGTTPRFVLVAGGSTNSELHQISHLLGRKSDAVRFEEVEAGLLADVSSLGSGTRVIAVWPVPKSSTDLSPDTGDNPPQPCIYLHGVGDPGNVGTIVRTADAFLDGPVVLGAGCADAYSPKAVRATMGSIFSSPPVQAGLAVTPEPRVALVAHGGQEFDTLAGAATVCLGAERDGLPDEVVAQCARKVTIPLRAGGAESLNVAAAAAIAAQRISSLAMRKAQSDA